MCQPPNSQRTVYGHLSLTWRASCPNNQPADTVPAGDTMDRASPSDKPETMISMKMLAIPIQVGAKVAKNLNARGEPMEFYVSTSVAI